MSKLLCVSHTIKKLFFQSPLSRFLDKVSYFFCFFFRVFLLMQLIISRPSIWFSVARKWLVKIWCLPLTEGSLKSFQFILLLLCLSSCVPALPLRASSSAWRRYTLCHFSYEYWYLSCFYSVWIMYFCVWTSVSYLEDSFNFYELEDQNLCLQIKIMSWFLLFELGKTIRRGLEHVFFFCFMLS